MCTFCFEGLFASILVSSFLVTKLYNYTLHCSITSCSSPDRPLLEILSSIKSDASESSLPSSGTASLRHLSESDSHVVGTLQLTPAIGIEVEHAGSRADGVTGSLGSYEPASKMRLEASGDFGSGYYEDLVPNRERGSGSPSLPCQQHQTPAAGPDYVSSQLSESPVILDVSDVPINIFQYTAKSSSPSISTPVDSLSSASVLSPQHGLESSTSSQGEQTDGVARDRPNGTSRSPAVMEKNRLLPQPEETAMDPRASSKALSATSSRGGSGTNTPRKGGSGTNTPRKGRSGTNTPKSQKGSSSSAKKAARHSPATGQGTPTVAHVRKSPQDLSAAVSAKLGDILATPEIRHSPATGQDAPPVMRKWPPQDFPAAVSDRLGCIVSPDDTLPSPLYIQERVEETGKVERDGEEEGEGLQVESIYDPVAASVPDGHSDAHVIDEAVKLSFPEASDSRMGRRRDRRDPRASACRTIISKPGLEDNNLRMFFKNIIADDTSEILMNITWGVCNLPSAPSCEIEVGTIISDKGLYLLEVLDPENHKSRPLSWTSENFPLAKITCCYHHTLRKLSIGIFDQSLTVESFEKGLVNRFVFFPHTYEKLNMFVENLKAVCDAHRLPYTVTSLEQSFMSGGKGFLILNPGSNDMAKLKENLVWSKSRAQVGSSLALNVRLETGKAADSLTSSYEYQLKQATSDTVEKFEIVQYVIVGELSCDVLPISDGKLHIQSRALILTNDTIYVCKEELDSWPHESTSIRTPPFPRCTVLDAHPIARISAIRVCDKSHPIVSCTDPVYEFAISFEELDDIQLSPTLSAEWVLCVHDRQYLDQLLKCLIHLSNELQREKLITVKHTSSQLTTPTQPKPPRLERLDTTHSRKEVGSKKSSISSYRGTSPCFFSSAVLFDFSVLTNYQRLKFFKKHIAQAEFMKSDEIPLSVFLAHCSSVPSEYVEIEACVLVSNYAIYLLSDVDSIQQWVEMGGVSSFPRKDLLDRKHSEQIRGFYRLWLKEIKQVDVGVFYDCVSITDTKDPQECRFTIHTENPSSTLSFLSALSCVVDLHDTVEEKVIDSILSEYDMVIDSVPVEQKKTKDSQELHYVEFIYHGEDQIGALKKAMVGISPAIAKGIPSHESVSTVKILYQQVVLLVEELRIRDLLTSRFYPHLVFLTNYGIYVCQNESSEKCSPSVMNPSRLSVKKWCHIDLLERLHVASPSTSQYSYYNVVIYLRTASRASLSTSEDSNSLSLLVQNSELLGSFLYHFSLMHREKCGRQITITRD